MTERRKTKLIFSRSFFRTQLHYLGNDEHSKYGFKSINVFFVRANIISAGDDIVELRFIGLVFTVFIPTVLFVFTMVNF
jgi:hypothetical protein